MGVFHISGLGKRLGAFTVPLTCVYLMLKASENGIKEANDFFATSGEEQQESKGAPEAFIIFTSEEVIGGGIDKYDSSPIELKGKNDLTDICRYFENLFQKTEMQPNYYEKSWLKDFYIVSIKHDNFEDCLEATLPTLYALRDKEIWISLVGGSNQVNISLLLSALFSTAGSRFYYVFQEKIAKLFPEWLELKHFKENLKEGTSKVLERWFDLPVPYLGFSDIIKELEDEFKDREILNSKQVEDILERHGLHKQVLSKLRKKWIITENERVRKGPFLEKIEKLFDFKNAPENYSQWKEAMAKKKRLYEIDLEKKKLTLVG